MEQRRSLFARIHLSGVIAPRGKALKIGPNITPFRHFFRRLPDTFRGPNTPFTR